MARYAQHFLVEVLPEHLHTTIVGALESCNLTITYKTDDYVIAQERDHRAFARLVTVEVLIHRSQIEGDKVRLTCVTKNGELPLQTNNHCSRMSDLVCRAFSDSSTWKLLEAIPG